MGKPPHGIFRRRIHTPRPWNRTILWNGNKLRRGFGPGCPRSNRRNQEGRPANYLRPWRINFRQGQRGNRAQVVSCYYCRPPLWVTAQTKPCVRREAVAGLDPASNARRCKDDPFKFDISLVRLGEFIHDCPVPVGQRPDARTHPLRHRRESRAARKFALRSKTPDKNLNRMQPQNTATDLPPPGR